MNLGALVATAFKSIPAGVKGAVVVTRKTGGAFNRATDSVSGGASQSFTAPNGVVLPVKEDKTGEGMAVDRQRQVLLSAAECTFRPEGGGTMYMTFEGGDWAIKSVKPLQPDGVTHTFYDCVVAK